MFFMGRKKEIQPPSLNSNPSQLGSQHLVMPSDLLTPWALWLTQEIALGPLVSNSVPLSVPSFRRLLKGQ